MVKKKDVKIYEQNPSDDLSSHGLPEVFSALMSLTALFGMVRGVSTSQKASAH